MSSPPWDYIAKLVCIGDSGCGKSSLTIRLCEGRFSAQHDVTIGVEFGSRIVPVGPPHSNTLLARAPSTTTTTTTTAKTKQAVPAAGGPGGGLPDPPRQPERAGAGKEGGGGDDGNGSGSGNAQKHMKLSLWDTAGQETYKSVTRSYFRGASGALLVFDITRKNTFEHVTDWLNDLRQIAEPDIVVILVGNKADLAQEREVGEEGRQGQGQGKGQRDASLAATATTARARSQREVTTAEAEAWAAKNGVMQYVETSAKSGEGVELAFCRVAERIFENINAGKYDLNDRRSGVKGPGPGQGGRQVKVNDANKRSSGCC